MVRAKSIYYLPPIFFSLTLFISAGLLFWIQPLIAKTLLPLLGGAPAVWNTCPTLFPNYAAAGIRLCPRIFEMAQPARTGDSTRILSTVGDGTSRSHSG